LATLSRSIAALSRSFDHLTITYRQLPQIVKN
jgi:hypothetical protein